MELSEISIVVGLDQREAIASHPICVSVLEEFSLPVQFIRLAENRLTGYEETHTDGSDRFIYSRKNWDSMTPWDCAHPAHRILPPEFIQIQTGAYLHCFSWLAIECENNDQARLTHYTQGPPCFNDCVDTAMAGQWNSTYRRVIDGMGV